jgi:putative transposase
VTAPVLAVYDAEMAGHRKQVRHGHEPGDVHELTFSCYRRMPLLTNEEWRRMLARSVDRAVERHAFRLTAFVFMPEHVHLLVAPTRPEPDLPGLLKAIKQPFSSQVKRQLAERGGGLLERLTVQERPGVTCFRFWQEGPGYDRNLWTEKAVLAAIDYIHMNPVRRGLCDRAVDWKWSSARRYVFPDGPVDEDLPKVHGVPYGL